MTTLGTPRSTMPPALAQAIARLQALGYTLQTVEPADDRFVATATKQGAIDTFRASAAGRDVVSAAQQVVRVLELR